MKNQKAIEILNSWDGVFIGYSSDEVHEAIKMATEALTLEQHIWTPVSESLPDEGDDCLCCDKDGYMATGWISKWTKRWTFDDDECDMNVVAWMPLPKPYKAESEE